MKSNIISNGILAVLLLMTKVTQAEDYYVKTLGYRVEPEPDPPSYVRNLSKTPFEQLRPIKWLDVGLDFRLRYEYRENDYRPVIPVTAGVTPQYRNRPDNLWLLRTRAYLGIKDILDPLRFAIEFQDSRRYNGLYEKTDADVNEFDLIQAYGELYFNNALGKDRPLTIRAGRMHLELLDRRLMGNNQFRNTTNNFEGYRLHLGKKQNDWDLDSFALQPIERNKYNFDQADEDTWIYGVVLSLRHWSKLITIQPYFFARNVNGDPYNSIVANQKNDKAIYAPGVRLYGILGKSGFDFDADFNKQLGDFGYTRSGQQIILEHDAIAYSLELGYSLNHEWKPRLSLYYGYGSGDKDPNRNSSSQTNQRFDSFYGFNQPWSRNDYFSWDNIHAPKARLEITPYKNVRIDTGYNVYWLASETESWNRANLRDVTGNSGSFLGHEVDIRLRHKLNAYVEWSLSYARFMPGDFTKSHALANTGPYTTEASNFFYFELSLNALGDGNIK